MNSTLVQQQLQLPYSRATWRPVLRELLPGLELFAQDAASPLASEREREIATARRQFGRATLTDGKIVALYEIDVVPAGVDLIRNRVGLRQLITRCIDQATAHAVLAFFLQPGAAVYRLTYAARESTIDLETLAVLTHETAARRYTYILGPGETRRTAASRLANLGEKRAAATLADVTDAFSVERLNNEFFTRYKEHYTVFCQHLLANEALTAVFHLDLADKTGKELDRARKPVRDFVKKLLGRLVFLHFLQKKGWLGCPALPPAQAAMPQEAVPWVGGQGDFIRRLFDGAPPSEKDHFHSARLVPLFFDTLNDSGRAGHLFGVTGTRVPYLNGGLFERDFVGVDTLDFPAALFHDLLDFFGQYHFTIDENDPEEQEIGIDPEMLGHIFENLLEDNKDKGAYYTPKAVVQYMAQQSLIHALAGRFPNDSAARGEIEKLIRFKEPIDSRDSQSWLATHATQIANHLDELKICDPAIGSGAFPIGLLQEIYWTQLTLNPALDRARAKRLVIQHSIHGVDLDAGAVEIARLRFWLALIVDEHVPRPLPNLDYQIMQGNSLLESFEGEKLDTLDQPVRYGVQRLGSDAFELPLAGAGADSGEMNVTVHTPAQHGLAELQRRYFVCHEPEAKARLRAEIDAAVLRAIDARFTLRREELEASLRSRAVFVGRAHQRGGDKQRAAMRAELDALAGKSASLRAMLANPRAERPFFLWHFWFREIFERNGGFDIVIANPPYIDVKNLPSADVDIFFANFKTAKNRINIYAVFIEHGYNLLNAGGVLAFINPNSLLVNESYSKVRELIIDDTLCLLKLPDRIFVNAIVETMLVFVQRRSHGAQAKVAYYLHDEPINFAQIHYVEVEKDTWRDDPETRFNIFGSVGEQDICKKMEQTPRRFLDDAEFCLGLTPYDRYRGHTPDLIKSRGYHASQKLSEDYVPLIDGSNITRYAVLNTPVEWLKYGPWLGAARERRFFTKPRIIVRQIVSGKPPRIFAGYTESELFHGQVGFVLLERNTAVVGLKVMLAILNSTLLNFYHQHRFLDREKVIFQKVLIANVKKFPLAVPLPAEQATITALVDQILAAKRTGDGAMVAALEAEIDTQVFRLYGLTPEEIALIQNGAG